MVKFGVLFGNVQKNTEKTTRRPFCDSNIELTICQNFELPILKWQSSHKISRHFLFIRDLSEIHIPDTDKCVLGMKGMERVQPLPSPSPFTFSLLPLRPFKAMQAEPWAGFIPSTSRGVRQPGGQRPRLGGHSRAASHHTRAVC